MQLNEDVTHNEYIEKAIYVENVPIKLEYELYVDDDFIQYDLLLPNESILKLSKAGVWFKDFDYENLDIIDRFILYQTSKTLSKKQSQAVGDLNDLKSSDILDLLNVKFKFGKKYTAEDFIKFFNNKPDYYGEDTITAYYKKPADNKKDYKNLKNNIEIDKFLKDLTSSEFTKQNLKHMYLIGRDKNYLTILPEFKELQKKTKVTVDEIVEKIHTLLGLADYEKSDKLLKNNAKTGIFEMKNLKTFESFESETAAPVAKTAAINLFGAQKVAEVEEMVAMSDPDFAFSHYEDEGDEDACSIIEMIYFEGDDY